MVVEDLNEAGHVGALEVMRQIHIHVEAGDGVLFAAAAIKNANRVANVFDTDLIDRDVTGIFAVLHVFNRCCCLAHALIPRCR